MEDEAASAAAAVVDGVGRGAAAVMAGSEGMAEYIKSGGLRATMGEVGSVAASAEAGAVEVAALVGSGALAGASAASAAGQEVLAALAPAGDTLVSGLARAGEYSFDTGATMAAAAAVAAGTAGTGIMACCASLRVSDVLKLEIFRDFQQVISTYFNGFFSSAALRDARNFFAPLANLVNLEIEWVVPEITREAILVAIAVFLLIAIIVMIYLKVASSLVNIDKVAQGLEVKDWDSEERSGVRFRIKLLMFWLMTIQMPLCVVALRVLFCDPYVIMTLDDINSGVITSDYLSAEELTMCKYVGSANVTSTGAEDDAAYAASQHASALNADGYTYNRALQDFECNCWEHPFMDQVFLGWIFPAALIIFCFGVVLPVWVYELINENKPVGSVEDPEICYDAEGNLIPYTDRMYALDLKSKPQQSSPYLFLYDGYERNWAHYKVIVMMFKLSVALFVVAFHWAPLYGAMVVCFVQVAFAGVSFYATPFLSDNCDRMDAAGRITCIIVIVLTILGMPEVDPSHSEATTYAIIVVMAVNLAFMALMLVAGLPAVKDAIKGFTGNITLKDSLAGRESSDFRSILAHWSPASEVRQLVWHTFWDGVLLHKYGDDVTARVESLKSKTREKGMHRIRAHFEAGSDPDVLAIRNGLVQQLEGIDVYYEGSLSSTVPRFPDTQHCGFFGKMYCVIYPFHAVFVPDLYDRTSFPYSAFIHDHAKLVELWKLNMEDPEIIVCRRGRETWREMTLFAHVDYYCQRWEVHRVADGTTGSGKNKKTAYSNVNILMTYNRGTVDVRSADEGEEFSHGFIPLIKYRDGYGSATKPRTGNSYNPTNYHADIIVSEIGLAAFNKREDAHGVQPLVYKSPEQWDPDSPNTTMRFFTRNGAARTRGAASIPESWFNKVVKYRRELDAKRVAKEMTLRSSFWYYVYMNDGLELDGIHQYFSTEPNPALRDLPTAHAAGLEFLMVQMRFARRHPRLTFWLAFWMSFWECNKTIACVGGRTAGKSTSVEERSPQERLFDPASAEAIMYRPMLRPQLEEVLATIEGLRRRTTYLSDAHIDALYEAFDGALPIGALPPPRADGAIGV